MAQIHFTAWLRSMVPDGPVTAAGSTVGEALDALLTERPQVRSYVLDEQGRLRKHVCIFADGTRLPREAALDSSDPVRIRNCMSCRLCQVDRVMSDRLLVSTRKGLIVLERKNGGWAIATTAFPGVAVTAALAMQRDGAIYAALKHGHFGPKLHRSDDGGRNFTEIGSPAFPADAAGARPCSSTGRWRPAARIIPTGCGWAPFRPACSAPRIAAQPGSSFARCGTCRSAANGSAAAMTTPAFIRCRPIRATATALVIAISCGGVWETRDDGKSWNRARQGADRGLHAAGSAGESRDPGPAPRWCAALPRPTTMWVQHHCGVFRSSDAGVDLHADQAAGRRFRLCRGGASERSEDRVARAGDQGRAAHAARRRHVRASHPRRRRDLAGAARRPAAAATPSTSSIATGSTWMQSGTRLAMGSTTGALWVSDDGGEAGSSSMRTCRRSMRCGSASRRSLRSHSGAGRQSGAPDVHVGHDFAYLARSGRHGMSRPVTAHAASGMTAAKPCTTKPGSRTCSSSWSPPG